MRIHIILACSALLVIAVAMGCKSTSGKGPAQSAGESIDQATETTVTTVKNGVITVRDAAVEVTQEVKRELRKALDEKDAGAGDAGE
jgi:hypothetical protein